MLEAVELSNEVINRLEGSEGQGQEVPRPQHLGQQAGHLPLQQGEERGQEQEQSGRHQHGVQGGGAWRDQCSQFSTFIGSHL